MFRKTLFTLFLLGVANAVEHIKVDPVTHTLVDELGRTRVFHGVNAVYKARNSRSSIRYAMGMLILCFVWLACTAFARFCNGKMLALGTGRTQVPPWVPASEGFDPGVLSNQTMHWNCIYVCDWLKLLHDDL